MFNINDFDFFKIKEYEQKIGKNYSCWTEQEKKDFILDLIVEELDDFASADKVEDCVALLKRKRFKEGYRNEYFSSDHRYLYKEIVLYNKKYAMIYTIFAFRMASDNNWLIDQSNLMFQISNNSLEKFEKAVANRDLPINVKSIRQSRNDRNTKIIIVNCAISDIIDVMKMDFEFVTPWDDEYRMYEFINIDDGPIDSIEELHRITISKIDKFSLDAQKIIRKNIK